MFARRLVMDTEVEKIVGDGSIDFARERYDLTLDAKAKRPSIVALRGPIVVDGTFRSPRVHPAMGPMAARVGASVALGAALTPLAALLPLIDVGGQRGCRLQGVDPGGAGQRRDACREDDGRRQARSRYGRARQRRAACYARRERLSKPHSRPPTYSHDDRRCRRARRRRLAVAAAVRRAAASRALRAHSVVHPQMPVLRFQFARSEGRGARSRRTSTRSSPISSSRCRRSGAGGSCRCSSAAAPRASSRPRRSTGCSPRFARAFRLRPMPKSRSKPIRERSSARNSAGFRAAGVNRLSLGIQSFDPGHLRALGSRARRKGGARGCRGGARDLRQRQLRLMYALPRQTIAQAQRRRCRGAGVRAAAPFVLSAHARAEHALPSRPAAVARRRCGRRHRGRRPFDAGRGGVPALRNLGARARGERVPAQSQLLAVRRLSRDRRGRAFQGFVPRPDRPPDPLQAAEAVSRTRDRRRAAAGRAPRSRATTSASSSC